MRYENPWMEVVVFGREDVVTTSGTIYVDPDNSTSLPDVGDGTSAGGTVW